MAKLLLNNVHAFLANKFIEDQADELGVEKNELTHGVVYALLFDNIRIKDNEPFGLRLTKEGFNWLKEHYDAYKITLNRSSLVGNHILYLDRYLEFPYYVIQRKFSRRPGLMAGTIVTPVVNKPGVDLYLFAGQDTIELKLLSGDIDKWVANRKTGETLENEWDLG
jgi:hypothetical protein